MSEPQETKEPQRFLDLNVDDLAPIGGIVRLGGHDYQMRSPDGLNLTEISELEQCERRFAKAMKALKLNARDRKASGEAEATLDLLLHVILPDMPAEELKSLGYLKKTKIYAFFSGRLGDFQRAIEAAISPSLSTMPTSSQD